MTGVMAAQSFADFNLSYILELVGLALVVVFIIRKVAPPLRSAMNSQAEKIRTQLAAGDEARAAAQRTVERRSEELAQAKTDAAALVAQAKVSATQLVEDGRRRGEDEHQRLVLRAATEIELARARAREEVTARIAELVIEAAEAVVKAELDGPLHRHLIADAITAAEAEGS